MDEIVSYRYAALREDPNSHEKLPEVRSALRFKVKGATDKTDLTLGYLEHGVGWTPSYMISLNADQTAQITMQAVVMNDAEDVSDAEVYFVVGVPNFAYSETPSPMGLQQNLLTFMKDAERRDLGASYRQYTNAIAGQLASYDAKELDRVNEPTFSQAVAELAGAPEEDLFLYTRSGVTLE